MVIGFLAVTNACAGASFAAAPATLANASVSFQTNNNDKDDDTRVSIQICDDDGVVCARISNFFGHFDNREPAGPYALNVINASTKDKLQRGKLYLRIDPNGHDTWQFNFFVEMKFSDGSTLSAGANGVDLTQDRRQVEYGTEGIIKDAPKTAEKIRAAKANFFSQKTKELKDETEAYEKLLKQTGLILFDKGRKLPADSHLKN